jgi:hypothetical protein
VTGKSILQPFLLARLPHGIGMRIEETFAGWYAPNEPHRLAERPDAQSHRPRHSVACEARLVLEIRDLNVFIEGDEPEASLSGEILFEHFAGARNASFRLDPSSSSVNYVRINVETGEAECLYRMVFLHGDQPFRLIGRRNMGQAGPEPLGLHQIARDYRILRIHVNQLWDSAAYEAGTAELTLDGFDETVTRRDLPTFLASHHVTGTEDPSLHLLAQMRFLAFTGHFLRQPATFGGVKPAPLPVQIPPIAQPREVENVALPGAPAEAHEPASEWDVFLCYNSADRPFVTEVERALRDAGLVSWLDESVLAPGSYWLDALDKALLEGRVRSAAVFVGPAGIGDSQQLEIRMLTDHANHKRLLVIPVILPDASDDSMKIPVLLRYLQNIDFRLKGKDAMKTLVDSVKRVARSRTTAS